MSPEFLYTACAILVLVILGGLGLKGWFRSFKERCHNEDCDGRMNFVCDEDYQSERCAHWKCDRCGEGELVRAHGSNIITHSSGRDPMADNSS